MNCIQIFLFLTVTHLASSELQWKTGTWSLCVTRGETCSLPGYRTRNVTCTGSSGDILPSEICEHQLGSKPELKSTSGCVSDYCIVANKHRLRYVETETPCAPVNSYHDNKNTNITKLFRNDNTKCAPNAALVNFVKTRRRECRFYHHENDNSNFVMADSKQCKKYMGVENVLEREMCYKKCVEKCALTLWTKWVRCTRCRAPIKYKNRAHASLNAPGSGCDNLPMLRVKSTKQEAATQKQYRVTGWRQVSVLYHKKHQFSRFSVYQRNVTCVHRRIGENCMVPSPDLVASHKVKVSDRDCIYTGWSIWSSCRRSPVNGDHGNETRLRHRRIFSFPLGYAGIPCNTSRLVEESPCTDSDAVTSNARKLAGTDFAWFAGSWSECRDQQHLLMPTPNNKRGQHHKCVVQKKRRHVFCTVYAKAAKTDGDNTSDDTSNALKPVDPLYCVPDMKPEEEQICGKVTCTQSRCAYREWSKWDTKCDYNQLKRRRQPISQSCPVSFQARTCNGSEPQWVEEKCQPLSANTCGDGKRNVVCKRGDAIVDDSLCDSVTRDSFEDSCKVPCTLSLTNRCVYSTWTLWSNCKAGFDNKTRSRTFLYGNKAVCKAPLAEIKECANEFYWIPSFWGACELLNVSETCGNGTQSRDYICVEEQSGMIVNETECLKHGHNNNTMAKPNELAPCYTCLQPASSTLTQWSKWEPDCAAICSPLKSAGLPTTSRRRYIVTYGRNYTLDRLIETKGCPSCLDYHWIVKNWDVCTHDRAPTMEQSEAFLDMHNGFQIRNVFCSDGSQFVADTMCRGPKPIESRDCHIDWLDTCNLKPWSVWTECDKLCGKGTQRRSRPSLPHGCQIDPIIRFNETRPCNTHPCAEYEIEESDWGECQLIGPSVSCSQSMTFQVNFGLMRRNVTCYSLEGEIVPQKYCEEIYDEKFETKKRCVLPCSTDCVLSEWTEFSACSATCGMGISARTRRVFQHASKDRVPCPHNNGQLVVETTPCKVMNCGDNEGVWKKGRWTQCRGEDDNNATCRAGIKRRTVQCIQTSTGLPSTNCSTHHKPKPEKQCKVPCLEDCLVSDWSVWTSCDRGKTNRKRSIVRPGKNCPELAQDVRCQPDAYKWRASGWSSCFLEQGNCGNGIKRRLVECINSKTNNVVPDDHCTATSLLIPQPSEFELCRKSCGRKCQLTDWTPWSSCDVGCGRLAHRSRQRTGRGNCKGINLKETLRCEVLPCYNLKVDEWSPCQSESPSLCGIGERRRSATCMRDDGNVVDLRHCADYMTGLVRLKEECSVSCWNDCVLTEWSRWSACFKSSCSPSESGDEGLQLRTRDILQEPTEGGLQCSTYLEEKRPCRDGACLSFEWRVNGEDELKCTRSDGLVVSTGCKLKEGMYRCGCPIPNGVCVQKEYCTCNQGYQAILNMDGSLESCAAILKVAKSEGKMSVSLAGIVCISLAACVGYCVLFTLLIVFYRRRKKQKLHQLQTNKEVNVPLQPLNNNQNNSTVVDNNRQHQQRNLIKNNRVRLFTDEEEAPDENCTSGFCSESTPLHEPPQPADDPV